ncbi:MAG: hypothetical protein GVX78_00610 [Bacteroidetes bacterium]|nr:hypothetical protein [Bacteroidota bacterium]
MKWFRIELPTEMKDPRSHEGGTGWDEMIRRDRGKLQLNKHGITRD